MNPSCLKCHWRSSKTSKKLQMKSTPRENVVGASWIRSGESKWPKKKPKAKAKRKAKPKPKAVPRRFGRKRKRSDTELQQQEDRQVAPALLDAPAEPVAAASKQELLEPSEPADQLIQVKHGPGSMT